MKKFLVIIMIFFAINSAMSQEKGLYTGVSGHVGIDRLEWEPILGLKMPEMNKWAPAGYGFALDLQYFFTENWGISTGVGASHFQGHAFIDAAWQKDSPETTPAWKGGGDRNHYLFKGYTENNGTPCDIYLSAKSWEERFNAWLINIPLMATFQQKWGIKEQAGIYVSAGMKLQIPVKQNYAVTTPSTLTLLGYFPETNNWIGYDNTQDVLIYGYGTTDNTGLTGKLNLKPTVALSMELGFLVSMSRRVDMTIAGYIDKGVTNMKRENTLPEGNLFYPKGQILQETNIIEQNYDYAGLTASYATNKVNTLSAGVKIGIRVKLGKLKTRPLIDSLQNQNRNRNNESPKVIIVRDTIYLPGGNSYLLPGDSINGGVFYPRYDYSIEQNLSRMGNREYLYPVSEGMDDKNFSESIRNKITDEDMKYLQEPVYFDLNSAVLSPAAREILDNKAAVLAKYPGLPLVIVGHTCDLGSEQLNIELSRHRAEAVLIYLARAGVPAYTLTPLAEGKNSPNIPNTSEQNRQKNRKVYFMLGK
ncbi:MAG: OmpA family protein [Bacteroidales bacterium]|jgi:outer membrane protein OmpA-like peptidoglycan-associated protein|nr:OmpA family protein [Bacteroidales bacterium]